MALRGRSYLANFSTALRLEAYQPFHVMTGAVHKKPALLMGRLECEEFEWLPHGQQRCRLA